MKMINGILGCALVAGLMTFATDKAQAGVNIGNVLYSPMKIKITALYQDGDKIKKMSVTSKDVLKELGYNNNVQLASDANNYDVWIINKDAVVRNLSTNDVLWLSYDYYTYTYSGNNDQKYTEYGLLDVNFESDQSSDYFYVTGVYKYTSSEGNVNNNGEYNFSESLSAKSLSGYGYFSDLSEDSATVTGSTSYKGGDKFQALE